MKAEMKTSELARSPGCEAPRREPHPRQSKSCLEVHLYAFRYRFTRATFLTLSLATTLNTIDSTTELRLLKLTRSLYTILLVRYPQLLRHVAVLVTVT
jgi:hypothetical protein